MIRILLLITILISTQLGFSQVVKDSIYYAGKTGSFIYYYPNGLLHHQGFTIDSEKEGTLYYYSSDDRLTQKIEYTFTHPKTGDYQEAQFVEIITDYYENGSIYEVNKYINGNRQFAQDGWYANGVRKYENIAHEDGIHETRILYYENGNKKYQFDRLINSRPQIKDGITISWNEGGIKTSETGYRNNLRHGIYRAWDDAGNLIADGAYKNDTMVRMKSWKSNGELAKFWSKDSPKETHFYKQYHHDTNLLERWTTFREFQLDTVKVVMRIDQEYDKNGDYDYTRVSIENSSRTVAYLEDGVMKNQSIIAGTFRILKGIDRTIGPLYNVYYFQKPVEMGTWIGQLKFPIAEGMEGHEKRIEKALKKNELKIKKNKLSKEYQCDLKNFENAAPYYMKIPQELFFDTAITTTWFDENNTGKYRIDYVGTEAYYEGYLLEGFEHGTSVLYLNPTVKLFEREYWHGLLHGLSIDYYLTGALAKEQEYWLGNKLEVKDYFLSGGLAKHERNSRRGQHTIMDKWHPNKNPASFSWEDDSTYYSINFNEDGSMNGYSIDNKLRTVRIRHNIKEGQDRIFVDIPKVKDRTIQYNISRYGYVVNVVARWDSITDQSSLEDNFGKQEYAYVDRSIISYSSALPCHCGDWEKPDFFAESTDKWISLRKFQKYQHKFHAPTDVIRFVFGNPYYLNGHEPDRYKFGRTYNVGAYFFSFKPIELFMADTNGIIFTLEPCKSQYAFIQFYANVSFKRGFPNATVINIGNPKSLSLTIPSQMLAQTDEKFQLLKDEDGHYLPGKFLFDAERVIYDNIKQLDVINPRFDCARPMQIGNTGIILEVYDLYPDFSETWNYDVMTNNLSTEEIDNTADLPLFSSEKFRGAFSTSGGIYMPFQVEDEVQKKLYFTAKNIAVSATACRGVLYSSIVDANSKLTLYTLSDEEITLTKTELEKILDQCNFTNYTLTFEIGQPVTIHFNYQL